jgi:hypothetical protein
MSGCNMFRALCFLNINSEIATISNELRFGHRSGMNNELSDDDVKLISQERDEVVYLLNLVMRQCHYRV